MSLSFYRMLNLWQDIKETKFEQEAELFTALMPNVQETDSEVQLNINSSQNYTGSSISSRYHLYQAREWSTEILSSWFEIWDRGGKCCHPSDGNLLKQTPKVETLLSHTTAPNLHRRRGSCTWPLCFQSLGIREGTEHPSGHPGCQGNLALAFVACKEPGWMGLSWLARQVTPASHLMISCTLSDNMTLRKRKKKKNVSNNPVCLMTCLGTVQKPSKNFLSQ